MRLFVAIRPSPAVRDVLLDVEAALRRQGRGTFTRPENLHLTLAFLGEAESAAPAQAAVMVLFILLFIILVIVAASFASKVMGTF